MSEIVTVKSVVHEGEVAQMYIFCEDATNPSDKCRTAVAPTDSYTGTDKKPAALDLLSVINGGRKPTSTV